MPRIWPPKSCHLDLGHDLGQDRAQDFFAGCSRFPDDDAIHACGSEESTHARYIHLKRKPRTHCICSAQSGVSKATYEMTYLMHTRLNYNTWSGH